MLGIYDSGVGGLSVLKAIQKKIPGLETVYFADTKNCPLGEKTIDEINDHVCFAVEELFKIGCNIVLLACNTATAVSIRYLQNSFLPKNYPTKKILGIITPILESVFEKHSKNKNIGILATPATIFSGFYEAELKSLGYSQIFDFPCPGLASSIEKNNIDLAEKALLNCFNKDLINLKKIDVLVLACTHYPFFKEEIEKILFETTGKTIQVFDPSKQVAISLDNYFKRKPVFKPNKGGLKFLVSGDKDEFYKIKASILRES